MNGSNEDRKLLLLFAANSSSLSSSILFIFCADAFLYDPQAFYSINLLSFVLFYNYCFYVTNWGILQDSIEIDIESI